MSEHRHWPRKACLEPCIVEPSPFGTKSIASRVIDYSHGGMRIESDEPLLPGTPVRIRLTLPPDEDLLTRLTRNIGLVRWCARQDGLFSAMYGAGIEILAGPTRRI